MPAPLQSLETWAAALLDRIGPAASLQLARRIAQDLRRRQLQRMRAQRAPDGAAWEPRKPLRTRKGRTIGKPKTGPMMRKLATARYLRASATAAQASVEFAGRAQRIAQVHHFGQRAAVNYPRGPMYDYPARGLIGLADEDLMRIRDLILQRVAGGHRT